MNRDTICVQGGYTPGNGEPRQIPIIQSTTFKYATSEDMEIFRERYPKVKFESII